MKTFPFLGKHICPVEGGCPASITTKELNTRPPHCLLIGLMVGGVTWCSVSVPWFSGSHHPHSCLLTIVRLFTSDKQAILISSHLTKFYQGTSSSRCALNTLIPNDLSRRFSTTAMILELGIFHSATSTIKQSKLFSAIF